MSRYLEYYTERRAELDLALSDSTLPITARGMIQDARDFCTRKIKQIEQGQIIVQN